MKAWRPIKLYLITLLQLCCWYSVGWAPWCPASSKFGQSSSTTGIVQKIWELSLKIHSEYMAANNSIWLTEYQGIYFALVRVRVFGWVGVRTSRDFLVATSPTVYLLMQFSGGKLWLIALRKSLVVRILTQPRNVAILYQRCTCFPQISKEILLEENSI